MRDFVLPFLDDLRRTFRVVDAIDILLVSIFLYAALLWFIKGASRGVIIGCGALAVVYFLARGLDMYLTSLAFQTVFTVLIFLLVVVFQEDLRRLLERLSTLGTLRPNSLFHRDPLDLDALVETVFRLADSHVGALIILKGREPLDRHLTRGIALDGRLSATLLMSIFDSHSPGHDGAAVVEGQRIKTFAAHLPISSSSHIVAGRGTRHSAALGLSERSDALTIVVSEERGVVSVASTGALYELRTASELKDRLCKFFAEVAPPQVHSIWQLAVFKDGWLKAVSLGIAGIAWLVLGYNPHTVQRTFVIPIEYRNVDPNLEIDALAPNEARLTLTGAEHHFRFLDPAGLKMSMDLNGIQSGYQELAVTEKSLRLPANLTPYRIEPRIIRLELLPRSGELSRLPKSRGKLWKQ